MKVKLLIEAIDLATHAHGKQARKYSGLPYIQHPIRVMHKLFALGGQVRHVVVGYDRVGISTIKRKNYECYQLNRNRT